MPNKEETIYQDDISVTETKGGILSSKQLRITGKKTPVYYKGLEYSKNWKNIGTYNDYYCFGGEEESKKKHAFAFTLRGVRNHVINKDIAFENGVNSKAAKPGYYDTLVEEGEGLYDELTRVMRLINMAEQE